MKNNMTPLLKRLETLEENEVLTSSLQAALAKANQTLVKQFRHENKDIAIMKTEGYLGSRYTFMIDSNVYTNEGKGWPSTGAAYEAAKKELLVAVVAASKDEPFTEEHLNKLRTEYAKLDKVDPMQPTYKKLTDYLDGLSDMHLKQIANGNIKFLSGLARNRVKSAVVMAAADPAMLAGYLQTALWSTNDNSTEQGGEPLDENYDTDDIDQATMDQAEKDCAEFVEKAGALLDGLDLGQVGHDFWLTRNGHGAGFWDGDYEKSIGDALTKLSEEFGKVDLYVGDDNRIYSSVEAADVGDAVNEANKPRTEEERFAQIDRVTEQLTKTDLPSDLKRKLERQLDDLNRAALIRSGGWYLMHVGDQIDAWLGYPFNPTIGEPLAVSQDIEKLGKMAKQFQESDERGRLPKVSKIEPQQMELHHYFKNPKFRELIRKGMK